MREAIVCGRNLYVQEFHGGGGNRTRVPYGQEQEFLQELLAKIAAKRVTLFAGKQTGLYVIEVPGGPVKIGVAVDPLDRVKTLQQGNPAALHLVCVIPGTTALERFLHSALRQHRMASEWFEPAPRVLAVVDELLSVAETLAPLAAEGAVDQHDVEETLCERARWERELAA